MNDPIISVCGHLCNDYIIAVEEYPAVGTSCRVTDRQNYYGGGAANIAVGIAKLGGTAELIDRQRKLFNRVHGEQCRRGSDNLF